MKRRQLLLALAAAPFGIPHVARAIETEITVYKSPT